tara:strand:- start:1249 stop:1821 length:573 start_codon:yes stop_codon:yes gene_type:complete
MVEIVNPLRNAIDIIESFGFFNVILPFILVYALVYGVLIKTDLFNFKDSPQGQNVSNVIAMASAFFVVASTDIVNQMLGIIPQATFMLVVLLFILMIFAMMGQSDNSWFGENSLFGKFKGLFAVIIVAVFLLMIDAGSPKGIPIVRQLNELLLGESTFAVGSEALGTLIGVSMVLLFPVIIIMFLNRKDS